jgi:Uma2 family endonuclease
MSVQRQPTLTAEEYLAIDRAAEQRSEYFAGEMFAMAGASEAHVTIASNALYLLVGQLKGRPCKAYGSDMRLKVGATGSYAYPDLMVVCGEVRVEDGRKDILLNPTVLIEVLSDSTEAYDRGRKFAHYQTIDSFTDYLLIAQDQHRIEHYTRQADGLWLYAAYNGLEETVPIPSIDCELPLAEVYDKVEFGAG